MNIHEHQAKEILKEFGAPTTEGLVIFNTENLVEKIKDFKSNQFVLKAQIHAGGRGKAGGVKLVKKEDIINVFLPTTPNPTSGFLLMVPKKDLIYLDVNFEQASKFIVSAGTTNIN